MIALGFFWAPAALSVYGRLLLWLLVVHHTACALNISIVS